MSEIKLKPCPFCGKKANLFVKDGVRVICSSCKASTQVLSDLMTTNGVAGNAVEAVISAWNKRVSQEENHDKN